ncbi:MAG: R3H domain-containing nucleic acid-binding protein [Myxococcota bacterium]|jgi:spoIIIJ-associated protein|nr:R3H domain-containing nucleic acid-binding protein [Myxococcota bacterium]
MSTDLSLFAQRAEQATREILVRMGVVALLTVRESADATLITIHTADSGLLIGKQGATLNALQLLIGLIAARGGLRGKVILDTEGYRHRRQASLEATAQRVADKALLTGRIMEIHTMSSYERRIIHLTLAEVPGVTTRSEGEGPQRRLLVIPTAHAAASSPAAPASSPAEEP